MVWLTLRQHRMQLLAMLVLLLGAGALLLFSGLEAQGYVAAHAPPGCPGPQDVCSEVNAGLADRYDAVYLFVGMLPLAAPVLVGAFWGAPLLAREYEQGTNKLAWTQAASLRRWLTVKLVLLATAVTVSGLVMSAMVSAWLPGFREAKGDTSFANAGVFSMVGVSPAVWWLFAFLFGAASGTVVRRVLPAMAVAVLGVATVTFVLFNLRDTYAEPVRLVTTQYETALDQGAMMKELTWLSPSGVESALPPFDVCSMPNTQRGAIEQETCLFEKGYQRVFYHHPTSRFWRFQWTEAGILLAGALPLGGLTVIRTLRRRN